jgi:predicted RNA-binding Zn-ribbon protein involved in translation (DUF1610 family)
VSEEQTAGWRDAEEARVRAREAVAGAFAKTPETATVRRCPTCGVETATLAARCPNCNKRYDRALPWLKDWMRWTLGVATAVGLVLLALALRPGIQETKQERATRLAREQAARVKTERARLVRQQRPVQGRVREYRVLPASAQDSERREMRRSLVLALEAAITADAKKRIERKEMDGPVKFTECGPLIRTAAAEADDRVLTKTLGRYDCVAVKSDVRRFGRTVALFGHPYIGTVDFTDGSYVFCKDNKVPGERGKALATVKLSPVCLGLDENAEEVGEGYIQPDE